MGGMCSRAPGAQLPAATAEDIQRLKSGGFLPILRSPEADIKQGNNGPETIYVAEYENGAEVTVLFLDEDRQANARTVSTTASARRCSAAART